MHFFSSTTAKASLLAMTIAVITGCSTNMNHSQEAVTERQLKDEVKIAFLPDIHFSDVYAEFGDDSFEGIPNSKSGKNAVIRSMYAELTSTRLFNENYFALLSALDDLVDRNIKYVALPGDFSDDGQPVHMQGLVKILDKYREEHGMVFFAAPGNHDPVRPFTAPGGKKDFLAANGKEQPIYSTDHDACINGQEESNERMAVICTDGIRYDGYQDIMAAMKNNGFYPQPDYLYYETPYTKYDTAGYSYETALKETTFENRQYEICSEGTGGTFKQEGYSNCFNVTDSSYLVEPIEGLWVLSIDANVYIPVSSADESQPELSANFSGSSNAGYNKMMTHKQQTLQWVNQVVQNAEAQGKTLITFSHFPMADFYNGASDTLADMFGDGSFQLKRVPKNNVAEALAATGIKLHIGGHMHFNDTNVVWSDDGKFLFNVQAPSMAAYVPAYKLVTLKPNNKAEVETVILDEVDRFDELFEHYAKEYDFLKANAPEKLWDRSILDVKSYSEFTSMHLRELTRLRLLPKNWDQEMRDMLFALDGKDMLIISQLDTDITIKDLRQLSGETEGAAELLVEEELGEVSPELANDWKSAELKANNIAREHNISLSDLESWTGFDLALDFYRLANAGELARRDISQNRLNQYLVLANTMEGVEIPETHTDLSEVGDIFKARFGMMFESLKLFANGMPNDHFELDMNNGTMTTLK